jgi:signal peptidase I
LPGETVVLSGTAPTVTIINKDHPDGFTLDEPYIDPTNYGGASDIRVNLNANEFFVLGDNRRVSSDSRIWGVLPAKDIVGRVFLRLYPLATLGVTPGEERYTEN